MNIFLQQVWNEGETIQTLDFSEMEKSDEFCPDCGAQLYIAYIGSSPDNYTSTLICADCNLQEQE